MKFWWFVAIQTDRSGSNAAMRFAKTKSGFLRKTRQPKQETVKETARRKLDEVDGSTTHAEKRMMWPAKMLKSTKADNRAIRCLNVTSNASPGKQCMQLPQGKAASRSQKVCNASGQPEIMVVTHHDERFGLKSRSKDQPDSRHNNRNLTL